MPGTNRGNQLNLFLFEAGYITRTPGGRDEVVSLAVHPMLVAPESVAYTDGSRSDVTKGSTSSAYHRTVAGRAPWIVATRGNFGVQPRGLGPYVGDGPTRFRRFWNEVVRWSDVQTAEEARACYEVLTGTPGVGPKIAAFDPERSVPFVNFYDLWNDRSFTCNIDNFGPRRAYRRGAGAGLVEYDLRVHEAGPLILSALGEAVLEPLMSAFTTWTEVNNLIDTLDVNVLLDAFTGAAGVGLASHLLVASMEALRSSSQRAIGVMQGRTIATGLREPGVASFIGDAADVRRLAEDMVVPLAAATPRDTTVPPGRVDFTTAGDDPTPELGQLDALQTLEALAEAAAFQAAAGALYGMSREAYAAFVTSGGLNSGPELAGTQEHHVGPTDTPASIERRYRVPWLLILELNDVLPDEALLPGSVLMIPTTRARGPQRIGGLATFDSHAGTSAWGCDLDVALRDDGAGDFRVVTGATALQQGAEVSWARLDGELRDLANQSPARAQPALLAAKAVAMLGSDKRIASVERATVAIVGETIVVRADLRAINGGLVPVDAGGAT